MENTAYYVKYFPQSDTMSDNKIGWVLIPIGIFLLWILDQNEDKPIENPSKGKEEYYLEFNKDEFFKNIIHTEGHFKNIKEKGVDKKGFLNCCVKHLADAEGHLDEAISHSLIVENEEASTKFRQLRDKVKSFRHNLQSGKVSPAEGIKRVRKIRREFEGFNPNFDISLCEACTIN